MHRIASHGCKILGSACWQEEEPEEKAPSAEDFVAQCRAMSVKELRTVSRLTRFSMLWRPVYTLESPVAGAQVSAVRVR